MGGACHGYVSLERGRRGAASGQGPQNWPCLSPCLFDLFPHFGPRALNIFTATPESKSDCVPQHGGWT